MKQCSLHLYPRMSPEAVKIIFGQDPDFLRHIGITMVLQDRFTMVELFDPDSALIGRFEDGRVGWRIKELNKAIPAPVASAPTTT